MLISIINSLIAPKVWWFSILWWGPTKRLCNGIETACEAVSPLTQLHHWPHHQRHHYYHNQLSSSSPVYSQVPRKLSLSLYLTFLAFLSQVPIKVCTFNCHKSKGCHKEQDEIKKNRRFANKEGGLCKFWRPPLLYDGQVVRLVGVWTKCQPDKMPTGHNANKRLAFCPDFFLWLAFC